HRSGHRVDPRWTRSHHRRQPVRSTGRKGSGIAITQSQVTGVAAAVYVAGACLGALFFGRLTDRYGRKKLFLITLAVYLVATALTAFSFTAWWFFLFRFFTGFGIGGEYAAINS